MLIITLKGVVATPIVFLGYPFQFGHIREAVEKAAHGIAQVQVASDSLRGQILLHKIEGLMAEANLCIFDLTTHNPNVAAEFGIAHGRGYPWVLLYCTDESLNPRPERENSVFSDVKGWDSLLYRDAAHLEAELRSKLPELLSHLAKARADGNVRASVSAEHLKPSRPLSKDDPRLYLIMSTILPV